MPLDARREFSKPASALLVAGAVTLLVALLHATGQLDLWELRTRDLRTIWTLPPERKPQDAFVCPDILMVNVTDESLQLVDEAAGEEGMRWPWDRQLYGFIVKACAEGKATSVLFDFILAEKGKSADEKELVEAIRSGPPTYLAGGFRESELSRSTKGPRSDYEELLKKFAIDVDTDGSVRIPERYEVVVLPSPGLSKAAAGLCDVSTPRDKDDLIRRYRLLSLFRGRYYPSFPLAALMAREKVRGVQVRHGQIIVGRVTIPVEADGAIRLRYYRPGTSFAWRSAWNVLKAWMDREAGEKPKLDFRDFEGRTIIFGTSAAGLTDLRVTPVKDMPGPEIHMTAFANILNGDYLRKSPAWVSVVLFAALAVFVSFVTRFSSALAGGAVTAGAALASVGGSVLLYQARWIVDLVPQIVAIVLAYASASTVNFLYEGRQRLRVKREFQRYLSPRVVEKILKIPDALSMAGERKTLTVFFMDFAGFTSMSEKLDPAELVALISEYHHEAAQEIFRTEGTLDKFIGDAIMAFWNDPIEQPDHALRACLAAVAAQKRLREMAVKMKERGLPEMRARIGINTGIATVGNMGAKGQVNYTVIGDEVNLASRLEGVNKEFGTEIIVSEACYGPANERLEARELALIRVKGKKVPVRIFELLGLKGEVPAERLKRSLVFEQGLLEFRRREFPRARELFLELSQDHDRAAAPYLALCDRYLKDPPPPEWDGSYRMETK